MKHKNKQEELKHHHEDDKKKETNNGQLELHKAVAQAWHSHFTHARDATSEFDLRRRNFQGKPSRFKLEAMRKAKAYDEAVNAQWDFKQSLWDSYEIVAMSKRLEAGLIFGHDLDDIRKIDEMNRRVLRKKKRESNNSLRNLFNKMSSRRFDDVADSHQEC